MMKILSVESIREADKYTILNEPIASVDLMERAANQCMHWLNDHYDIFTELTFFCGLGNNGGDGLAIARMWYEIGSKSKVFIVNHSKNHSVDFDINLKRLKETVVPITFVDSVSAISGISENEIIIDSILGSGLNSPTNGLIAEVIDFINSLKNKKIAIDLPSGLFADKSNKPEDAIINADITLSFELPKLAFFFPQNYKVAGNWIILPIQLSADFIKSAKTDNYYITKEFVMRIYKPRNKFAHKGNYGHSLIAAGSQGKMGAAVLAAKACLRAGVGLLTIHCPKVGLNILQTSIPEAMVEHDIDDRCISCIHHLEKYDVIGIGPGIGQDIKTHQALQELLVNFKNPMVIDADALNILSEHKTWMQYVPENSILTPHFKEFERLTHKVENDFDRNRLQREFSIRHKVYIVLKGANTAITTPQGDCFFNTTGNPGMATGGSGDVLTGFLVSLLSQGYSSFDASILGVFLHGLAGDIFAGKNSEESLIASDLAENIGWAIKEISS